MTIGPRGIGTGGSVYLRSCLKTLAPYLARVDVTDLCINQPGEIWLHTVHGNVERVVAPELEEAGLHRLAQQVAALSHQGISREHPLLSATMPDGARIQVVAPPATRDTLAMAIRKHVSSRKRLNDYVESGAFASTRTDPFTQYAQKWDALRALQAAGRFDELLTTAVAQRRNILVSGGTASGKTTFLNALIAEIPAEERLILIEDAPELQSAHANVVGLVAARSGLGEASVKSSDLLGAALRMRPDRIILGELRGEETFTFLRAVNTGHPGSLATIHADSALSAIEQMAMLVLESGTRLSQRYIHDYVRRVIDIFVHLDRADGRRRVAEVILGEQIAAAD